ncbi:MAG: TlpA disulfide reductase family protein [Acidobacteriota bacterium]
MVVCTLRRLASLGTLIALALVPAARASEAPVAGDIPVIKTITAAPTVISQGKTTTVALKFTFSDMGLNLRNGFLKVVIVRSSGSTSEVSVQLTKPKYQLATGTDTVKIQVACDQSRYVKLNVKLRDAAGNFSGTKQIVLPTPGTQVGQQAINFTLTDQDGAARSLRDYAGKVVLLDLSAMWCGPCQDEASEAEALFEKYRDRGFVILSVLIEDYNGNPPDQADCSTWAKSYGLQFPVLADTNELAWDLYNDDGYIPLNVVIDRKQTIVYKDVGFPDSKIEPAIVQALSK